MKENDNQKKQNKIMILFSKAYLLIIRNIKSIIAKKNKINDNQIMFITFQGSYTCNPRAIADELIRRKSPVKLIWAIRKENEKNLSQYPKELKLVDRSSMDFYNSMASSKIIVENSTNIQYLNYKKKNNQYYIQTWHGSFGLKKSDPSSVKNKRWLKKAIKGGRLADFCISNSEFENNYYRNTYWQTSEILTVGHPRNDILFGTNKIEIDKINNNIREKYKIGKDKKILLYAPTFRDDNFKNPYDIDYERLINVLEKKFGGKWCIMVRFHFNVRNSATLNSDTKGVINVTNYADIQELLSIIDIGITDYSSWICDYVLTGKPCFLYANDMNDYIKERGFYYDLNITPFAVARDNDELEKIIINYNSVEYNKKKNEYLKFVGCFEDGNASKKVVDKIEELLSK